MGTCKKIDTLNQFVDWVKSIQKDIAKISRQFERIFDDELESGNVEVLDFMNTLNGLYSMTDNLKNNSTNLVQQYESDLSSENEGQEGRFF